jgi:uncharacterized protein
MMCKRASSALASMLSLGLIAMLPAPGHAASVDCMRPANLSETLACRTDTRLSQLDDQLNAAYATARAQSGNAAQLASEQDAWLARRNQCVTHACVLDTYVARLGELGAGAKAETTAAAWDRLTRGTGAGAQGATNAAPPAVPDDAAREAFVAACSTVMSPADFEAPDIVNMTQAVRARREAQRTGGDQMGDAIRKVQGIVAAMEAARSRNPTDPSLRIGECVHRYLAFLQSMDAPSREIANQQAAQAKAAYEAERARKQAERDAADAAYREAKAAAQREVDSLPTCDNATVLGAVKGMLADSPAGRLSGLRVSGFEQVRDTTSGVDVAHPHRYCSANLLTTAGAMRGAYSIRWTEAHDDIWVEARLLPN